MTFGQSSFDMVGQNYIFIGQNLFSDLKLFCCPYYHIFYENVIDQHYSFNIDWKKSELEPEVWR